MHITKHRFISAAFGLAVFGLPAASADSSKVPGLWKIEAFHTENVATKAQNRLYGDVRLAS